MGSAARSVLAFFNNLPANTTTIGIPGGITIPANSSAPVTAPFPITVLSTAALGPDTITFLATATGAPSHSGIPAVSLRDQRTAFRHLFGRAQPGSRIARRDVHGESQWRNSAIHLFMVRCSIRNWAAGLVFPWHAGCLHSKCDRDRQHTRLNWGQLQRNRLQQYRDHDKSAGANADCEWHTVPRPVRVCLVNAHWPIDCCARADGSATSQRDQYTVRVHGLVGCGSGDPCIFPQRSLLCTRPASKLSIS